MESNTNVRKNEASVINLDDSQLRGYVAEIVRKNVEETLLDACVRKAEICSIKQDEKIYENEGKNSHAGAWISPWMKL